MSDDEMTFGSLFAGIGGIDLGLERAGWKARWQVEIDDFATGVLARHWPDVPRHRDVREVGALNLERVTLIAGDFPCQDISVAGKGAGLDGQRSGLWFEFLRVVQELRPDWVLAENVPGLRTRGADIVLGGLEEAGYSCWPLVVGARHVGAPHRRDRVWIVARRMGDADRGDSVGWADLAQRGAKERAASDWTSASTGGGPEIVAHAGSEGLAERRGRPERAGPEVPLSLGGSGDRRWPTRPGELQHPWEEPRTVDYPVRGRHGSEEGQVRTGRDGTLGAGEGAPQPPLGGSAHGLPVRLAGRHRRAALKALGNSVVPQVAEFLGHSIITLHGIPDAG